MKRLLVLVLMLVAIAFAQQDGDSGEGGFDGPGGDDEGGPQSAGTDDFGGGDGGDEGSFDGAGSEGGPDDGFDGAPSGGSSGEESSDSFDRKKRSAEEEPYPLVRVRRGGHKGYGVVGPVHTHVRTDYHGNFQWGVRHKAGGGYGGGGYHG